MEELVQKQKELIRNLSSQLKLSESRNNYLRAENMVLNSKCNNLKKLVIELEEVNSRLPILVVSRMCI